MPKSNFEAKE